MRESQEGVVVVGAGPAGLATAATLQWKGIPVQVLERADHVASSWCSRYDSLILNTPRFTSTLAGYRIPRRYGRFPARDDFVAYLEEYARRNEIQIRFGVEVQGLQRQSDDWMLTTSAGPLDARYVVIATGHDREPMIPDWPGRGEFEGEFLHSAEYRNPQPFRGKRVLVVSGSNSGTEISNELVSNGAAKVWTSMRSVPPVFPREWLGMPLNYTACLLDTLPDRLVDRITNNTQRLIYGDLSPHGIPPAPVGVQTRAKQLHKGSLIDAGFIDSLKCGRIELLAAVKSFDGQEVVLIDETRLRPDAVIAATGFNSGLRPLVGHLGVLDAMGYPAVIAGRTHPNAPRLYFNGYLESVSGQLRHMRRHARSIARAIARERGRSKATVSSPRVPA